MENTWPVDGDRLLTTEEVGYRLGGSNRAFVLELIHAGLLTSICFGRVRRVRLVTLNEFLAKYDGEDLVKLVKERTCGEQEKSS